ncbi:VOC family protein [Desulfobacterales bacterium HSG17]|nr:VOC family protein [Desulfobacterales bacterium HSG17]
MISRIDHVSIAVKDYDKAIDFFSKIFNVIPGASGSDPMMKYSWEIFSAGDLSRLELLNPTGKGSFLDNFLSDKKSGGVHHITFETPDIFKAKQRLEDNNIPYFGFKDHGNFWKELFIHPKHAFGVLIQIAEFQPDEWLNPSLVFSAGKKWSVEKNKDRTDLTFAHPGGGKVKIELTKEEIKRLIDDLNS